jgi:hypothetical protein
MTSVCILITFSTIMSFMIEVYLGLPQNVAQELEIAKLVEPMGGKVTFHEGPLDKPPSSYVCLTIEFQQRANAEVAAEKLRSLGKHLEGVSDYGKD